MASSSMILLTILFVMRGTPFFCRLFYYSKADIASPQWPSSLGHGLLFGGNAV